MTALLVLHPRLSGWYSLTARPPMYLSHESRWVVACPRSRFAFFFPVRKQAKEQVLSAQDTRERVRHLIEIVVRGSLPDRPSFLLLCL